jgi:hypothetical protein
MKNLKDATLFLQITIFLNEDGIVLSVFFLLIVMYGCLCVVLSYIREPNFCLSRLKPRSRRGNGKVLSSRLPNWAEESYEN